MNGASSAKDASVTLYVVRGTDATDMHCSAALHSFRLRMRYLADDGTATPAALARSSASFGGPLMAGATLAFAAGAGTGTAAAAGAGVAAGAGAGSPGTATCATVMGGGLHMYQLQSVWTCYSRNQTMYKVVTYAKKQVSTSRRNQA